MWGLENYQPQFVETLDEVLELGRALAGEVVGKTIDAVWTAWLPGEQGRDDTWWDDAPVIIEIGGVLYELCWIETTRFALTRNSIELTEPFHWFGSEELVLEWRQHTHGLVSDLLGQQIIGIELMETMFEVRSRDSVEVRLIPNAIDFLVEGGRLSVFNAFDKNGIGHDLIHEEGVRYIAL
jgi:hypothetical protein